MQGGDVVAVPVVAAPPVVVAARPVLALPDGHVGLEPVDAVPAGLEGGRPVRRGDADHDADLAEGHRAEPVQVLRAETGASLTNLAFGGPERKTLYCTESTSGSVLRAGMSHPGAKVHRPDQVV